MTRATTEGARGASWSARIGALLAVAALGLAGAGQAAAAPGAAQRGPVAGLISEIAKANQNIADLDNAIAVRQENVNRSLVDYQNSLVAKRLANAAALGAQRSLKTTTQALATAQREFDNFVRQAYRQGSEQGSMANYVASPDPQGVLDRMHLLDQISRDHQATIKRLNVARNQQANRVAAAEATKRQAGYAASSAAQRRNDAVASLSQARDVMNSEQTRRGSLVRQRDAAQVRLDRIRGVKPHRVDAQAPADLLANLFPTLPGRPGGGALPPGTPVDDNQALQVAAEAAARLAMDLGQKLIAGLIGEQQVPHSQLLDELGIGGSRMGGSSGDTLSARLGTGSLGSLLGSSGGGMVRPGLRGPQAVEIIVNRALSQLNVPYAWGGGDANGPTQGIRDGGVADSFGDYNKTGFDCSGLMIYAFAGVGIELPHYTGYQYTSGPQVPLSQMRRGDMIFYGPNASQHVALYLGDNKMVEAPQSGDVVKVSPLRTDGAMPNAVRLL